MKIFTSECRSHSIMYDANKVFAYLAEFPEQDSMQLSFF